MTEKSKSPAKKYCKYIGIGLVLVILYFTRSMWPLMFMGEPIATINATIPPDKQLRLGIGLESSSCKVVTASSGRLINAGRGWSKRYTPDSDGKVTVEVKPNSLSLCDWKMKSFSIAVWHKDVPEYVGDIDFIPHEVTNNVKLNYTKNDYSQSHGGASFKNNEKLDGEERDDTFVIEETLVPLVTQVRNRFGDYIYRFNYFTQYVKGENNYIVNFNEPFKIDYVVHEDKNELVFREEDYIDDTKFETTAFGGRKELPFRSYLGKEDVKE